ncbi:MAG TPA: hypothetical protein VIY48_01775 [Candidatus Paceibacterota bacterium]
MYLTPNLFAENSDKAKEQELLQLAKALDAEAEEEVEYQLRMLERRSELEREPATLQDLGLT